MKEGEGKSGRQGKRPPPGTKFRILSAAKTRLRAGQSIHEIKLSDLATDCRVTRAAAAFHFGDGMRGVVAGLAMESALELRRRIEAIPVSKTGDGNALSEVGKAVLGLYLDDADTAVAVQSMRWGWRVDAQDAVHKGLGKALTEMEKRLPPGLHARLVLGVAEYFFGEVRRRAMSAKVAERSLIDTLERIAAP